MKAIIGLGNPGTKYMKTKHNVGFMTVDEIADQKATSFNKKQFEAEVAEYFENGEKILLIKPQTFMNESGRSVSPLMSYYNLQLKDVLVIYDDLDLSTGKIRLRTKGSAGGHNGVKSLISHLGTQEIQRIKVGIDRPLPGKDVISHVLGTFPKESYEDMLLAVKDAAAAAILWTETSDFTLTMNQFNSRK